MIAPRIRQFILGGLAAVGLLLSIAPSFAQPAPVPALPDAERRISYSITASTCACSLGANLALYGDSNDYWNWVEVYLNGVLVNYNDATFGWTITSPSGSLANLARPITDGVLTFTNPQTGIVQIVGARRPRRVSQFSENAGVSARNLNQVLTDIIAQNRETWDKINDVTGRAIVGLPGETLATLPPASVRAGGFLCFDGTGLIPKVCSPLTGTGNVVGPNSATDGHLALYNGATGQIIRDGGAPSPSATTDTTNATNITSGTLATARGGAGANNSTNNAGDILASNSANGSFVHTALNAICSVTPSVCTLIVGRTNIIWYGAVCDGATNDTTAIQAAITAVYAAGSYGTLYIPPSSNGCLITQQGSNTFALQIPGPMNVKGDGMLSNLKTSTTIPTTVDDLVVNVGTAANDWRGIVFDGFSIGDEANWQPPSYQAYTRHGRRGIWFDSGTQPNGFEAVTIRNMYIGESGVEYSLYIDGQATTRFLVDHNQIYGGLNIPNDADFMTMVNNLFGGIGSFGIYINTPGAGHMNFCFNTVITPGALTVDSGVLPVICNNYFEEVVHPLTIGGFINVAGGVGTVQSAQVYGNYVNVDVSTTAAAVVFNNSAGHHLFGNEFNMSTARAAVSSAGSLWGCGYNTFSTTPHISGTVPGNNYGSC